MSKQILIVDDSSIMRKMLIKTLQAAGHDIIGEAASGAEAIELYKSLSPDLVTMDITMRGMDGISAAEEIIKSDASAKVLILSNLDEDKYRDRVASIGAMGLMNKQKTAEILAAIKNCDDT